MWQPTSSLFLEHLSAEFANRIVMTIEPSGNCSDMLLEFPLAKNDALSNDDKCLFSNETSSNGIHDKHHCEKNVRNSGRDVELMRNGFPFLKNFIIALGFELFIHFTFEFCVQFLKPCCLRNV